MPSYGRLRLGQVRQPNYATIAKRSMVGKVGLEPTCACARPLLKRVWIPAFHHLPWLPSSDSNT